MHLPGVQREGYGTWFVKCVCLSFLTMFSTKTRNKTTKVMPGGSVLCLLDFEFNGFVFKLMAWKLSEKANTHRLTNLLSCASTKRYNGWATMMSCMLCTSVASQCPTLSRLRETLTHRTPLKKALAVADMNMHIGVLTRAFRMCQVFAF